MEYTWSSDPNGNVLKEYRAAVDQICISPKIMKESIIANKITYLQSVATRLRMDVILENLIMKAYTIKKDDVKRFSGESLVGDSNDRAYSSNYFHEISSYANSLNSTKREFLTALNLLTTTEESDGLKGNSFYVL